VFPSKIVGAEMEERLKKKILLAGPHCALAMRVGGRFLSRIAAALRLRRFGECGGMIAFAVQLGGGMMGLRGGFMILSSFRVGGHWHW
jgi:hypothetical protein